MKPQKLTLLNVEKIYYNFSAIKYFPEFFAESHNGTTLINWIESFYTEEEFGEWLKKRRLGGTWRH